jgi:hypothetical protein
MRLVNLKVNFRFMILILKNSKNRRISHLLTFIAMDSVAPKETKEQKAARRAEKAERKAAKAERKAAKAERKASKHESEPEDGSLAVSNKKRRRSADSDIVESPVKPTKAAREANVVAVASRPRTRSTDSLADALAKPAGPVALPAGRPRTRSTDNLADALAAKPLVGSRPRARSGGTPGELGAAGKAAAPAQRSAAEFMAEHAMIVKGPPGFVCPAPMESFSSTPFPPALVAKCTAAGFGAPTITQALSWPIALTGANLVSVAKTGSGKTLGYLFPSFLRMLNDSAGKPAPPPGGYMEAGKPALLVLAPTRELACQIEEECKKFGRSVGLRSTYVSWRGNWVVFRYSHPTRFISPPAGASTVARPSPFRSARFERVSRWSLAPLVGSWTWPMTAACRSAMLSTSFSMKP